MAGFDTPKALAKALAKAAEEMRELDAASAELGALGVSLARKLCPQRKGTLRASIAFRVGKPSKGLHTQVRITAGGSRAPYAAPIHWGWKRRNIRPQPFLMDALGRMDSSGAIEDTYIEKVEEILGKVL